MTDTSPHKLSTEELVAGKPSGDQFARQPRNPIYVVCDNIRSLVNVGLIFRLCDAARVEKLFLCGITGYPLAPNDSRPPWVSDRAARQIAKTAIHTVEFVPWEYRESAIAVASELKARGVQIVVLEQTNRSVSYAHVAYRFPVCLVLGHERQGVEDALLDLADHVVEIPMHGMGNSLNVAMALGIVVYEILRCCVGHPPEGADSCI